MNFFKRTTKLGLEKAEQLNLITELEKLQLEKQRAEEKYSKAVKKKDKPKKKA